MNIFNRYPKMAFPYKQILIIKFITKSFQQQLNTFFSLLLNIQLTKKNTKTTFFWIFLNIFYKNNVSAIHNFECEVISLPHTI